MAGLGVHGTEESAGRPDIDRQSTRRDESWCPSDPTQPPTVGAGSAKISFTVTLLGIREPSSGMFSGCAADTTHWPGTTKALAICLHSCEKLSLPAHASTVLESDFSMRVIFHTRQASALGCISQSPARATKRRHAKACKLRPPASGSLNPPPRANQRTTAKKPLRLPSVGIV